MLKLNSHSSKLLLPVWQEVKKLLPPNSTRNISHSYPLAFNVSPCLMALPVKRKRRLDPAIIKQREERKIKKLEKELRQLEKMEKPLRPIEEARPPQVFYTHKEQRQRLIQVPDDVNEERIATFKEWCRVMAIVSRLERKEIRKITESQEHALKALRAESQKLYEHAVEMDPKFIPFLISGPVETPPIQGYRTPDGDYIDISKNWDE